MIQILWNFLNMFRLFDFVGNVQVNDDTLNVWRCRRWHRPRYLIPNQRSARCAMQQQQNLNAYQNKESQSSKTNASLLRSKAAQMRCCLNDGLHSKVDESFCKLDASCAYLTECDTYLPEKHESTKTWCDTSWCDRFLVCCADLETDTRALFYGLFQRKTRKICFFFLCSCKICEMTLAQN